MRGSILAAVTMATAMAVPAFAQTDLVSYAQLNGTGATGAQPPVVSPNPSGSSLTFYPDRGAFDGVIPVANQSCEDFEDSNIADGSIAGFPSPLDSTTNTAEFPPGSIVAGLTIQDNPLNDTGGGSADGLVAVGNTAVGATSDLVLANTFVDSLDMLFAGGVDGVAMDVFSFTAGGTVSVTVFDTSDNLLGSTMVAGAPGVGGFLGVSSAIPIGRINLDSLDGTGANEAEGGDNICFGNGGGVIDPPDPVEVPAMSSAGFVLLGSFLLGVAAFSLRRRRVE